MSLNKQVKIILIETSNSGNIGSALRAMKTMSFSKLCLVNPKDFPSEQVETLAANAKDLIEDIEVVETLDEALEGLNFVIGTSSRMRKVPWPNEALDQVSSKINSEANKGSNIGIIFGREDRGLTNDELQRCNLHVHIPANEEYPVLNIAMAVQVVCYQLYVDSHKNNQTNDSNYWDVPLAESNHVERLINHFVEVASELEVFNKGNPRQIGARIKRMFTRIGLDEMEVNFLRGFLGAVEKKLKNK
mgnify:CR=1 FL=1|tara:strand:+ start:745 stop:1482 length:738 start_codon:yes stop_codon:yes gene_type:complete